MIPDLWIPVLLVAIPAVASVIVSIVNTRKLTEIHAIVNSRLTELVSANARAERAEGMVQGGLDSAAVTTMVEAAVAKALERVPVVADVPVIVAPVTVPTPASEKSPP